MVCLQTGYSHLDRALKGMRAGEVIILAARPAQGKSVRGQQISTYTALAGHGTILFSLEMPEGELADRHFAAHARTVYGMIRAANLTNRDLNRIATEANRLGARHPTAGHLRPRTTHHQSTTHLRPSAGATGSRRPQTTH